MENELVISRQVNDVIINAGRKYAQLFENDNLGFTQAMLRLTGSRGLMKWVYGMLVARKLLKPLEELTQEQKEEIWDFVKDICVDEFRTREMMYQMAIVFYTIEYFLNEDKNKQ